MSKILWVIRFCQIIVICVLSAVIISPVFLKFDADGAVRITKPWEPEERRTVEKNPENPQENPATAEATASVSIINLSDSKCDVNIKKNENPAPAVMNKPGSGNVAEGSSIKYVNVLMAVAAYVLLMIFLALVLRWLRKAGRKQELIYKHGGAFRKLLAASPDRAEYQKTFMREMMRIYFDKEAD